MECAGLPELLLDTVKTKAVIQVTALHNAYSLFTSDLLYSGSNALSSNLGYRLTFRFSLPLNVHGLRTTDN